MADKDWAQWTSFAMLSLACLANADFTTECPRPCDCKWQSGNKAAICANASLKHLPEKLSNEIQNLEFSNNPVKQLNHEAFKKVGLSNLKKLVLRDCQIETIHKTAFSSLGIMIELDLSKNRIKFLSSETFRETEKLRWINLSNNLIEKLEDGLFRNLKFLQKVELSNNRIVRVEMRTFVNLPRLQILRLDGNNLTHMKPEVLSSLGHLSSLDLNNNPWRCDCNLQPFKNWVMTNNLYTAPTSCFEPLPVRGKQWNDLDTSSFACRPTILEPLPNSMFKSRDENITLICKVVGNPTPEVYWKFNSKVIDPSLNMEKYLLSDNTLDLIRWVNLTVHNARQADRGIYTCVAENLGGVDEKNVTLVLSKYSGSLSIDNETLAILIGCMTATIIVSLSLVTICYFSPCKRKNKRFFKTDAHSSNGEALIDCSVGSENDKTLHCEVNPVTKPPRKYDAPPSVTSEATEMSELNRTLLDSESTITSTEVSNLRHDLMTVNKISQEALLDERFISTNQTYPPDLLTFPLRDLQISPHNNDQYKEKRISVKSPAYTNNMASLKLQYPITPQSYPFGSTRSGYVTLPRQPKNWFNHSTNGFVTDYDNLTLYNQYYKSELDLGSNGKVLQAYHIQRSFDDEETPSPAPGTPHASAPRPSMSSPNIHNQLLALKAFAETSGQFKLAYKLDRSLGVRPEDMKNPVIRTNGSGATVGIGVPKVRKINSEVTNPFLDSLDNATQV